MRDTCDGWYRPGSHSVQSGEEMSGAAWPSTQGWQVAAARGEKKPRPQAATRDQRVQGYKEDKEETFERARLGHVPN